MKPDLVTFAKGVTSGYIPLGGVMVGNRVADVLIAKGGEFNHGYTYSGHPVACAVALANLELMEREGLVDRVKNGDVAVDFLRPIDIQLGYLAADLGRAACTLIPRGIPSVIFGYLTFGLALPASPWPYLLGAVSVLCAVTLSFLSLFAVGLIGFWVVETRGIRVLYQICGTFLAGLFVPVHMFPEGLRVFAHATPFPSILQAPIDILSGRVLGTEAMTVVATQAVWIVVIGIAGRMLLAAGRRRLEVQGG